MGCAFILDVLEDINIQLKACFLVSGFIGNLNIKDLDEINSSIANKAFDWEKIRNSCRKFILFHSDNDPYVLLKKAEELKQKLDAKLIIIKSGGHFNEEAGYRKFEELLKKIKTI